MTKVDTMSKEKRCDWCFTSAQSKQAKTMGRDTSRREGQGPCQGPNISLTHVHCCANLYKTVSRTLSIIWSISCYLAMLPKLEFESLPWQEHVCECVEVSIWVQAIPNDWVGDTPGTHLAEPGSPYLGDERQIIPIQHIPHICHGSHGYTRVKKFWPV